MSAPSLETPRPPSGAMASGARTGLVTLIATPLVAYRIAPGFMALLGVPIENQPGFAELLVPALTGALVGALAALGTIARDLAHARGGNVSNIVGKLLP